MSTAIDQAQLVVGARVVAPADGQCTDRGVIRQLSPYAPVAIVRFDCGCAAYVPLHRLRPDRMSAPATCEVGGCDAPRHEGPYCAAHRAHRPASPPRKIGEEFEPKARVAVPRPHSPRPRAAGSAAIDSARTAAAAGQGTPAAASRGPGRPVAWTAAAIVAAMRRWADERGRPPTYQEWKAADPHGRRPCSLTVFQRFGSWAAGLRAAGYPPTPTARSPWTATSIVDALRAWAAQHGRTPTQMDWHLAAEGRPTTKVVIARMGSWSAAIAAAGLPANRPGRRREVRT